MGPKTECPECGERVGKGSTFCINCGARLSSRKQETPEDIMRDELQGDISSSDSSTKHEETLKEVQKKGFTRASFGPDADSDSTEAPTLEETALDVVDDKESDVLPSDELVWEHEEPELQPIQQEDNITEPQIAPRMDISEKDTTKEDKLDMSWEIPEIEADEVKEGMPFKEVKPPEIKTEEIIEESETNKAVKHLFPEGRGEAKQNFVERIVGKPKEIKAPEKMQEMEIPSCPNCGIALSDDDFEYPQYVYEAMAKARMEFGEKKIEENEHEYAIEQFEKSKKLAERASEDKLIKESIKKVDEAYEKMAQFHYDQGESHKKQGQYEWAIVQFKKAREIYMLTTDKKMRGKSAEKARECYVDWGEHLEDKGDELAKAGRTREALATYQEAAEKYREGNKRKKLRGLEKKIRNA